MVRMAAKAQEDTHKFVVISLRLFYFPTIGVFGKKRNQSLGGQLQWAATQNNLNHGTYGC